MPNHDTLRELINKIRSERPPTRLGIIDINGPQIPAWHLLDVNNVAMCGVVPSLRHAHESYPNGSDVVVCSLCVLFEQHVPL